MRIARTDPRKIHVPPVQARDLFLKGSFETDGMNPQSNARAREYFRQAIEADPEYASAYNNLAVTIWDRNIVAGERPVLEERRQAETLWRKALAIDPDLRGARVSLSLYAMHTIGTGSGPSANSKRYWQRALMPPPKISCRCSTWSKGGGPKPTSIGASARISTP